MDVARAAGVSAMTVTRALNDHSYVRAETRKKVLAACRKLNYRQNLTASILRGSRSKVLGVVVHTFRHSYYARFLDGVEKAAREAGHHIVVLHAEGSADECYSLKWDNIEFLLARQIDGLILHVKFPENIMLRLESERIPIVFVDQSSRRKGLFVGTADHEGAREMTEYILSLGHRRIAFLGGPEDAYTSCERLEGYREALKAAGLSANRNWLTHTDYRLEGGYQAMRQLLVRCGPDAFTAVVSANDYVAIGAMSALREAGIKVPGQMSVAGFTGDEIGAFLNPPLTTMVQPGKEIGIRAVDLLLAKVRGDSTSNKACLLAPKLVIRSSTAPARA